MKSLLASVAVLVGFASYAEPAKADYISCDGCDAYQMHDAAMYAGDGAHTVYDVSAGVIRHYQVWGWGETELEFGREVSVTEAPATPGELASMQKLRELALIYGAPMAMGIEIPISEFKNSTISLSQPNITAYDIQSDANIRADIRDRIESRISMRQQVVTGWEELIQAASNIFGTAVPYTLTVTIVGDDGSRISFSKTGKYNGFNLVIGSGKFSNGQVIPAANSPDYQATWTFTNDTSINDFMGALLDIGARFDGISSGSGTITVVCEWRSTESTLYCTRQL